MAAGSMFEAGHALSFLPPALVKAARDKVEASLVKKIALEGYLGALSPPAVGHSLDRVSGIDIRPEAIILREVRPPLLVSDGMFVPPEDPLPEVAAQLTRLSQSPDRVASIRAATGLVGRIAFLNVPGRGHHGTGWVIRRDAEDSAIAVTNRHVAEAFALADGRGAYMFRTLPNFADMALEIDFIRERGNPLRQDARVVQVLFMSPARGPDLALLRVRGEELRKMVFPADVLPPTASPRMEMNIGVVGYPGFSPDADPAVQYHYFRGVFDVKRIGFGLVTSLLDDAPEFTHDATTLGGNSGSVVFDTDTGALVGLHYGGITGTANYAVRIEEVVAALQGLEPRSVRAGLAAAEPAAAENASSHKGQFAGRNGYDPAFLGEGSILPPRLPSEQNGVLAAAIDDDTAANTPELKYRHFSLWLSRERLLPLITAVNIDGAQSKRTGWPGRWFLDHRLPPAAQVTDGGYKDQALELDQMVRPEDAGWGSIEEAAEATQDCFSLANAVPRHEAFGQQDWRRLEDYVLAAIRVRGQRMSVFSGPVCLPGDPRLRGSVQVPMAFWKIIVAINDTDGALAVAGFLVCQGDLIRVLTQEFVSGGYRAYQLPLDRLGAITGLDVSHLAAQDALLRNAAAGGPSGPQLRVISGPNDICR